MTRLSTRLGDALLICILVVAMYRAHRNQRPATEVAQDASFWIVCIGLGWWQPWYVVWFACLAAFDPAGVGTRAILDRGVGGTAGIV